MSQKTDRKTVILHTALELFWKEGYSNVGMERICKEAGVNKGSLYYYFASKDALAADIIDTLKQYHEDKILIPAYQKDIPALQRIRRHVLLMMARGGDAVADDIRGFCGCPVGNLAIELSTRHADIRAKLSGLFDEYKMYFQEALSDAIAEGALPPDSDIVALSNLLLSSLQGAIMLAKTENNPGLILPTMDALLNLMNPAVALNGGTALGVDAEYV